jgi:predicted dienelactone hydrolase
MLRIRLVLLGLTGLLALTLAVAAAAATDPEAPPAPEPPASPEALGPFSVGHMLVDVVDSDREDRTLPTRIWYPVDPEDAGGTPTKYVLLGPLGIDSEVAVDDLPPSDRKFRPLVIFSHGSGGTNIQSIALMETLASHGFYVAAPDHTGNTTTDVTNGTSDPSDVVARNRPQDVSVVIDYMIARSFDVAGPFFLRISPWQIGVSGHSFGGFTAIAMASGYEDIPPDRRVRAILPVSASTDAFSDEQLASIRIPTLHLGGTLDTLVPIDPNTVRAWEQISTFGLDHYRADIIGATHSHFANICTIADFLIGFGIPPRDWPSIGAAALIGPWIETCLPSSYPIDEAVRQQNLYSVAFFKRYLSWDFRYQFFLTLAYNGANEPEVNFLRAHPEACGLGFELVAIVPAIAWARRRLRSRSG